MLRLVEVKAVRNCLTQNLIKYNTLTNVIRSEYINLDEVLLEMRVRPAEIQMRLPRYFREDLNPDKDKRNQIVDKFMLDLRETNLPEEEVIEDKANLDTNMESVIRMIQKIERGRQGIVRALKAIYYKRKEQLRGDRKKGGKPADFDVDDAEELKKEQVTSIQKTVRGFLARRKVEKIR